MSSAGLGDNVQDEGLLRDEDEVGRRAFKRGVDAACELDEGTREGEEAPPPDFDPFV